MEYHLTKKHLSQAQFALDSVTEQPVDIDLTLPDYCPDIERILCCTLIPKLYIVNVSGDRLNIEGGSCVRVMYTDAEQKCVRAYEHTVPFSASLPLGEISGDCAVYADAKPEYLNCRALSPRKLSLHGAFSLYAKVAVSSDLDYCGYEDGGDLEVRTEKPEVSALRGLCSESFAVQEDIPMNGETGALISHRLFARITDLKAIHHKIMLSAELRLELLYQTDGEKRELACMSYSIPVSRVIDCDGADEDTVIDGSLSVLSDELRLSDDALDGSAVLGLEARLHFSAMCWHDETIEVLCDAFSTEREAAVRTSPLTCDAGVVCRTYTDIGKASVSVDESIGRVIDVHCEKLSVTPSENDGLTLTAKLSAGILYENAEGEMRCVERDAVFTYRPDTGGCDTVKRLKASLDSLSYRLADDRTLELRAELCYRLTLCRRVSCAAVSAVSADDDAPAHASDSAVILYYTDESDSVWDISKRFCSRPADIIAENDLDGDTVEGGVMLLIPTA